MLARVIKNYLLVSMFQDVSKFVFDATHNKTNGYPLCCYHNSVAYANVSKYKLFMANIMINDSGTEKNFTYSN